MTTPAKGRAVEFVVPLVPPSANSYVRHTRAGRHYRTREADQFIMAVALFAGGQSLKADAYAVELTVYLGHGQKGDADNFLKVALDSLVKCGVIHSDAAITDLTIRKRRDPKQPRTEFTVRGS